jgi:hypothetical protein
MSLLSKYGTIAVDNPATGANAWANTANATGSTVHTYADVFLGGGTALNVDVIRIISSTGISSNMGGTVTTTLGAIASTSVDAPVKTYGSVTSPDSNNALWGLTFTKAMLESPSFGVRIGLRNTAVSQISHYLDITGFGFQFDDPDMRIYGITVDVAVGYLAYNSNRGAVDYVRINVYYDGGVITKQVRAANTGANDASVGTVDWVNPGNVADLGVINFATITYASTTSATISGVRMFKSGVPTGDTNGTGQAIATYTVQTINTFFGASRDLWGTTWSVSDITNPKFGAGISVLNTTTSKYLYASNFAFRFPDNAVIEGIQTMFSIGKKTTFIAVDSCIITVYYSINGKVLSTTKVGSLTTVTLIPNVEPRTITNTAYDTDGTASLVNDAVTPNIEHILQVGQTSNIAEEAFIKFDTSILPDDAEIVDVELSFAYKKGASLDFTDETAANNLQSIYAEIYDWGVGDPTALDWMTPTERAASATIVAYTGLDYVQDNKRLKLVSNNSALSLINRTDSTKFVLTHNNYGTIVQPSTSSDIRAIGFWNVDAPTVDLMPQLKIMYREAAVEVSSFEKYYDAKIYDPNGTYVGSWDSGMIIDEPRFPTSIDAVSADVSLQLAVSFDNAAIRKTVQAKYKVVIWVYDREVSNGRELLTGEIESWQKYTASDLQEYYEVKIVSPGADMVNHSVEAITDIQYSNLVEPRRGDLTDDGTVNNDDSTILFANFGLSVTPWSLGDLNGDGIVDDIDFSTMLSHWAMPPSDTYPLAAGAYAGSSFIASSNNASSLALVLSSNAYPSMLSAMTVRLYADNGNGVPGELLEEQIGTLSLAADNWGVLGVDSNYHLNHPIYGALTATRVKMQLSPFIRLTVGSRYHLVAGPFITDHSFLEVLPRSDGISPSAVDNYLVHDNGTNTWTKDDGTLPLIAVESGTVTSQVSYLNTDIGIIMRALMDSYNRGSGKVQYTALSIQLTGVAVDVDFKAENVLDAVTKLQRQAPVGWHFFVDVALNIFYFRSKDDSPVHKIKMGTHISRLNPQYDASNIVSAIHFTGGEVSPGVNFFKVYENEASIARYGYIKQDYIDNRVTLESTARRLSEKVLELGAEVSVTIPLSLIDSGWTDSAPNGITGYDIESLQVGDVVYIRNVGEKPTSLSLWDVGNWDDMYWDYDIEDIESLDLEIVKLNYLGDTIDVTIGTMPDDIAKQLNDVTKGLYDVQTADNPIAETEE